MDFLTRFGIENSRFTVLMMLAILLAGAFTYIQLPKRENPAITIRSAVVTAQFPGMKPERMEELVATPIERKIREIGEIEDIETLIFTGSLQITVTLYDNVPGERIPEVMQDLRNKMAEITNLPDGTIGPQTNTDYGDVAIATVAVTGDGFSLAEVEDIAEDFRKYLYGIEGITKVNLYGTQDERVWLELDPRRIAAVGVQLEQVLNDLKNQNVILPAGRIDASGTNILLEANGDLRSIDEIKGVLTKVQGLAGYVRLSDLMSVRRGYVDPKETPVLFNGEPAIVVAIEMADDQDIQKLGRLLKQQISAFENTQPIGIAFNISTFQETNVTLSVNNALLNVGQTFLVVFIVMFAFMGLRPAAIIASIVPFTIMFALMAMVQLGVDLEQVSIAAVIISLGLLVDNGLVVVEDIENKIARGVDPNEAAIQAGGQFFIPLAVASITTVSAFLPMLMMDGSEGEFAFSLGAVVSSMLLGSWLTAHYILPFLCANFLKPKAATVADDSKPTGLTAGYETLIRILLPRGLISIIVAFGLIVAAVQVFPLLKNEMFPLGERAEFLVYMDMPKGTSISETERQASRANAWLSDKSVNPDVVNTTIFVGDGGPRFYLALDPADRDPTSAFMVVNTTSHAAAVETAERARRHFIEKHPEARFRITRLSMGGSESGIVDIKIIGPDPDALMQAAAKVTAGFAKLPKLVKNEDDWGNKIIKVVVDISQDKARELGVTSKEISEIMEAYFSGTQYSVFREGDEQIPIVLRATREKRNSLEGLANLTVAAGDKLISVDQVATFKPRLEFAQIRRENQFRQITISAKSATLSAQQTLAHIRPLLDSLALGPEYEIKVAGEIEESAKVYGQLSGNLPYALMVMLAALMFQFNSVRRVALTFLTIPLVLIGSPLALWMVDRPMSFFAVLGLISLMGIIINNAIVMIDQIDLERRTRDLQDAITTAARKRAKPIMLTSLTTILGLVPMAISGGALFEPMATAMIGGMLVSSPLTLIFVPSLYYLFFRWDKPHLNRDDDKPASEVAPQAAR
ncbi:MAG: efflux RND transporter permease subunit [Pseudomonadota bacterium]